MYIICICTHKRPHTDTHKAFFPHQRTVREGPACKRANRVDGEPRGVLVLGERRVQLAHWDDGLWAVKCWPLPALPHGFQAHAGTRAEEETKKQEESLHGGTMVSVLAVLVIAILTVR